jgi:hypothetical protein
MRDMPVLLIFRCADLLQVMLWIKCVGELKCIALAFALVVGW